MTISTGQLRRIMPRLTDDSAAEWISPINDSMVAFAVDETLARIAAFLAQIAHESGELRYVREIWGPTPTQLRYEGRADLGNVVAGDGARFMGRGLIQVTGRTNYTACSLALFGDDSLLTEPELLEEPKAAADSAAWFWQVHGLNPLADVGDFMTISVRINGRGKDGLPNGYDQRITYLRRAKLALGMI